MNEQITLGATAVMTGLTIGTGLVRWAVTPVRPPGRRRAGHVRPVLTDAELLGDWPEPTHGTPLVWAFRECPRTGLDQPHALHDDGSHTCSCCFTTTVVGGVR